MKEEGKKLCNAREVFPEEEKTASAKALRQAEGAQQTQEKGAEGDEIREAGLSQKPQKGTWIFFSVSHPGSQGR